MTDIGSTRLIRIDESKYSYRRLYEQNVRILDADKVEIIYKTHFPHDGGRNEEHVLLALDIEHSTAFEILKPSPHPIPRASVKILQELAKKMNAYPTGIGWFLALCPFHDDHNPSLVFNTDHFICLACLKKGYLDELRHKVLGTPSGPAQDNHE